jgi:hypothetical protein
MNNLKQMSGPHSAFVPTRTIDARWLLGSFALSFLLMGAVSFAGGQKLPSPQQHAGRTLAVQATHSRVQPGKLLAPTAKFAPVASRGVRPGPTP